MTYNEWRDELKSNLLCVSEAERRRVLDYYAEAYADRRDAGFTEREIIADFGAPYDAAQKILYENAEDIQRDNSFGQDKSYQDRRRQNTRQNDDPFFENRSGNSQTPPNYGSGNENVPPYGQSQYAPPPPPPAPERRGDFTWVFVILCIILAVPMFGVLMGLIGTTIGFIAAPFGVLIGGVATIGAGIGMLFTDPLNGAVTIGVGLMLFGISLVLIPLFVKLVKLMWTLLKKLILWVKSLFIGRGKTV